MAISGIVSSSSREVPYAPASVSSSDVGTARAYNNASATVSFTAPVHDGGLPVTGYTVTSSPGGLTASGASSPLTVAGLSSSTSYTYSVTATNSRGTGPSRSSGSVFATTIPQPATIGTATATGAAGTVSVAFTPNGTGGKTVTYTATSSPGGFTGSSSGSPISVSGLTNGTAYTFTVVAANANGAAAASAASNSATPYTYVPPSGPIGSSSPVASASENTVTSSSGSWGAGTTPTSYTYNLYTSAGTFVATSGSQSTSVTSFGFTANYSTSYYVTVTASNANGSGTMTSNTVTTGPVPPSGPIGSVTPVASASGNTVTSNSGSWGAGTTPTSYTYMLWSISGAYITTSGSQPASVTSWTFSSLNYSSSYYVTVTANNVYGSGTMQSNTVTTGVEPITGIVAGLPRNLYLTANTSSTGGTYGFSAPSTGTFPITVHYQFILQYAGPVVSSTVTFNNSSESANFSTSSNGYYRLNTYASNPYGTSTAVETPAPNSYTPFQYTAPVAPGSMAGLVSGYYSGGVLYYNWSAPTGTGPFTYYYSFAGSGTSTATTATSVTNFQTSATIAVVASNSVGSGAAGTAYASAPAPVVAPGSMSGRVSGSYNNGVITFSWTTPTGTAPFTYYYTFGSNFLSTTSNSVSTTSSAETITIYANNSAGSGGNGSASAAAPPTVVAPGSMSGLVSGSYSGGNSNFSWSAPSGTAPFTYYYSFNGYGYSSTTGTSVSNSGDSTISVYASNSAGSGGSGSASAAAPVAAPYRYYCRTSVQCGGVGNCTDNGGSTTNQTQSGSGYNIACLYNNTGTYPACQSTAGAGCTSNLSCCSGGTMYICNNYDYSDPSSANYAGHCYSVGACDAPYNSSGSRAACCPAACS